jgi:hypothetical protein
VTEFSAAAIVIWQLRREGEGLETRAVRLIGMTVFALAARGAATASCNVLRDDCLFAVIPIPYVKSGSGQWS